MKACSRMTRAELIKRLKALEARAVAGNTRQHRSSRELASPRTLSENGEWLHMVVQTAVEGVITINERGIIEAINSTAQTMFGYSAAEVVGQNVRMLMPAPFQRRHDQFLARYLRTGRTFAGGPAPQMFGRRKDGTAFPTGLSIAEVRVGNRRVFTGLVRDLTERKRLEKEILEISEREQRRIGQDLHDGLGQHLAAIELMSRVLEKKLEHKSKTDAVGAAKIAAQVREAMKQTRLLARGLSPVVLESRGLMAALQELSSSTEQLFRIKCRFRCDTPVLVEDHTVATHLHRIAQEAVSNAVKHSRAGRIDIELSGGSDKLVLAVRDNGVGFSKAAEGKGMGLQTMNYRATTIGGALLIQKQAKRGTVVLCTIQHPAFKA